MPKFLNPPHARKRAEPIPLAEADLPTFTRSPDYCGIYFLLKGGLVVYVGQSVAVHVRVHQHVASGKDFDAYAVLPWPAAGLNDKEAEMILKYDPPLNGGIPVNSKYVSSLGIKHKAGTHKGKVARMVRESGLRPHCRCSFGVFFLRSELETVFGKLRRTSTRD